jgi:hypothetical protein
MKWEAVVIRRWKRTAFYFEQFENSFKGYVVSYRYRQSEAV